MTPKTEVTSHLDRLLSDGKALLSSFKTGERYSDVPESDFRAFHTAALAAISRVAGRESEYYRAVPELESGRRLSFPGYGSSPIDALGGGLTALRSAVEEGLLQSLEVRLRANVHDDFLQQAHALLEAGYYVAAMVLVGGVLENHLQKMATARGLTYKGAGAIAKYNDGLLRDAVYSQSVWRRIQAVADLRNDAAHGNSGKLTVADVKDSLRYVERLTSDYPS